MVEITIENIKELLFEELCRVANKYNGSPQELISALVLPPFAYKLYEEACKLECQYMHWGREGKCVMSFQGIPLFVGPVTVIISVYDRRRWYCAHEDSK